MKGTIRRPTRGRPREFDPEKALERALHIFWRKGYQGTSLSDLTRVMGINRPSLYAAFGNKESLFRKVVDRYSSGPIAYIERALEEPNARAVAERLLRGEIELLVDPKTPAGCLIVQGALSCGRAADSIRRELSIRRAMAEAAICRRFQQAKREGDLPRRVNPADLARYLAIVMNGMAVQRTSGATRSQLVGVMKTVLRAWPR